MGLNMFLKILVLCLSILSVVLGYITRLPCIDYADFFPTQDYYYEGTKIATHTKDSPRDCSIACIRYNKCTFATYFKDLDVDNCVLNEGLQDEAKKIKRDKTTSIQTNPDPKLKGPTCEHSNACPADQYCRDVCSPDGDLTYVCLTIADAQTVATVTANGGEGSHFVNDGNHISAYIPTYDALTHTGNEMFVELYLNNIFDVSVIVVFTDMTTPAPRDDCRIWWTDTPSYEDGGVVTNELIQAFDVFGPIFWIKITNFWPMGIAEIKILV